MIELKNFKESFNQIAISFYKNPQYAKTIYFKNGGKQRLIRKNRANSSLHNPNAKTRSILDNGFISTTNLLKKKK